MQATLSIDLFNNPTKGQFKYFYWLWTYAPETKMKTKYRSGDINGERRQAELSFFYVPLNIDLPIILQLIIQIF